MIKTWEEMQGKKISKYTLARALRVYEIYEAHYEEGNQSRSARWVYQYKVRPVYAISESTYKRYLRIARKYYQREMRNEE